MAPKVQIAIAWLEEEQIVVRYGRTDLGESHRFKTIPKPMACMWLNEGTAADIAMAEAYAASEGRTVLTYEKEGNPLEAARRDILKGVTA